MKRFFVEGMSWNIYCVFITWHCENKYVAGNVFGVQGAFNENFNWPTSISCKMLKLRLYNNINLHRLRAISNPWLIRVFFKGAQGMRGGIMNPMEYRAAISFLYIRGHTPRDAFNEILDVWSCKETGIGNSNVVGHGGNRSNRSNCTAAPSPLLIKAPSTRGRPPS